MKKNSTFTLRSGNKPSMAKLSGISPLKKESVKYDEEGNIVTSPKINLPPSIKRPLQPKKHTLRGITGFEADFPKTVRHLRKIRKTGKQYIDITSPKQNIKRVKKLGKKIKDYFTLK